MEKFYFEIPSLQRKEEAIEYINEHVKANSNINGSGGMDKILDGITYEEWLEDVLKCEDKDYANSKGLVPATTYFTIRKSDNKIIGMINFRHYLNDFLKKSGGHIGYGIRPNERRKGYAKLQLYMALKEARKMHIDEIMVSCLDTNIGSEKTILALGGILNRIEHDEIKNRNEKIHWINVEESLERYKDLYEEYVIEKGGEVNVNNKSK